MPYGAQHTRLKRQQFLDTPRTHPVTIASHSGHQASQVVAVPHTDLKSQLDKVCSALEQQQAKLDSAHQARQAILELQTDVKTQLEKLRSALDVVAVPHTDLKSRLDKVCSTLDQQQAKLDSAHQARQAILELQTDVKTQLEKLRSALDEQRVKSEPAQHAREILSELSQINHFTWSDVERELLAYQNVYHQLLNFACTSGFRRLPDDMRKDIEDGIGKCREKIEKLRRQTEPYQLAAARNKEIDELVSRAERSGRSWENLVEACLVKYYELPSQEIAPLLSRIEKIQWAINAERLLNSASNDPQEQYFQITSAINNMPPGASMPHLRRLREAQKNLEPRITENEEIEQVRKVLAEVNYLRTFQHRDPALKTHALERAHDILINLAVSKIPTAQLHHEIESQLTDVKFRLNEQRSKFISEESKKHQQLQLKYQQWALGEIAEAEKWTYEKCLVWLQEKVFPEFENGRLERNFSSFVSNFGPDSQYVRNIISDLTGAERIRYGEFNPSSDKLKRLSPYKKNLNVNFAIVALHAATLRYLGHINPNLLDPVVFQYYSSVLNELLTDIIQKQCEWFQESRKGILTLRKNFENVGY